MGILGIGWGFNFKNTQADEPKVYIPNDGVRRDIINALNQKDIDVENELPTKSMLDELNSYDLTNEDEQNSIRVTVTNDSFNSIDGVQYLKNLESVELQIWYDGEETIDFRPLKNSKNLKILSSYIYRESNEIDSITDISPLSNLEKLERIELFRALIIDLTPLNKSLKANNLQYVNLDAGDGLLSYDTLSLPKEQTRYELKNPVKYPQVFDSIPGISYEITAYYTNEQFSSFSESSQNGTQIPATLEDGVIELTKLPNDKSSFNYLNIKISAESNGNTPNSIMYLTHSVSLSYPIHLY